jgi:hypothetical protein
MKTQISKRKNHAMNVFEVLAIIAMLALVVVIVLPALARAKIRHDLADRDCVFNIRQLGLSFRVWQQDNGDKYPTDVSVTNGGVKELAAVGNIASIFQVMSNEISSPKILVCPLDKEHYPPAADFADPRLKNKISYFLGLDVTTNLDPDRLFLGDANFLINGSAIKSGLLEITSNTPIAWDDTRHVYVTKTGWFSKAKTAHGNINFADGSVQQLKQSDWERTISQTGLATNRFAIP